MCREAENSENDIKSILLYEIEQYRKQIVKLEVDKSQDPLWKIFFQKQ